mmetsp:Transcript_104069/g.184482  ORF Transcript_104069/g.184482 Transcript_104069/m.184482 type:complete len:262 (-) Transcript_104069:99-884(-)
MGASGSGQSEDPAQSGDAQPALDPSPKHETSWTLEKSDLLQSAVDNVFGTLGSSLKGLTFSFTIADPQLDGCPLIGCSTGFTTLCGYEMPEIVGRNCRFLVDPVPVDQQDKPMRDRCREFCVAAKEGKDYKLPPHELDPWIPADRPANELFAVQKNARKNGEFFNNMFYMKYLGLGDFDDERLYLVALQSELPGGRADLAQFGANLRQLDKNMAKVEKILAKEFIITGSMRRQDDDDDDEDLDLPDKDATDEIIPSSAIGG